ncbi:hypothetical protein C2857_000037 [Epichloe festucae Fl1]|uniref:Uncharacterized protein n=1 Tax=Epichloe festucae (strain Fl1) TaxID=877507 RepID=A0A7U3SN00_EPIFF|nr:hypothetical protein C2857_000037 [Epichloe festucae Fl1]
MSPVRGRQHTDGTAPGRKRQFASLCNQGPEEERQTQRSKKKKPNHPDIPPPRFWDELSSIPLTRKALRELNRRNIAGGRPSRHQEPEQTSRPAPTIERFARQGGPDLTDIRGCRLRDKTVTAMSSSQSSLGRRKRGSHSLSKSNATHHTSSTRSTGPYDRAFQQHLIDHRIFPDGYEYPDGTSPPEPGNVDEILQTIAQPRASLSPSRFSTHDFRKFKRADTHAFKERDITTTVIPIIEGSVSDRKCVAGDIPFTNLDHLTDGTIVPGNPDLYYGARPEQLDRRIRRDLNGQIIPSTQCDLPIAPNFFLEAKGPDGTLSVACRQSCYDGALGARGIHSLQSHGITEPQYDNKAYTISSIYHGGQLKMYSTHPIAPCDSEAKPGYVTTHVRSWALAGDADSFRQGAAAYRNARDWTKQMRDEAIKLANQRTFGNQPDSSRSGDLDSATAREASREGTIITSQETALKPNSNVSPPWDSDTSADELSLDLTFWQPAKRTEFRSRPPRKKR